MTHTLLIRPVAALLGGALLAAMLAQPAAADDRGWSTTIVTGTTLPPREHVARQRPWPRPEPWTRPQPLPRPQPVSAHRLETGSVPAAEGKPAQESAAAPAREAPRSKAVQQYCVNIATAAADARIAWQKRMLGEVEQELDKRIAKLEAKTAEYQKWLARRDEFVKKAQEQLVGIFSRMRPDAAAPQLAASDEETAAAVLSKLDTRISSAILQEMDPNHAARLTAIMVGAGRTAPKSARATPDGRRS